MKIKVIIGTEEYTAKAPYIGAPYVRVRGVKCPKCGHEDVDVAGIKGGVSKTDERGMESVCACYYCIAKIGKIIVTYDTLFGITEDEAVLFGKPRVY